MVKLNYLVGATIFFLCSVSNASIIDNGTYTTDTTSGLDWLDITETLFKSYNEIYAYGTYSKFKGWRYASGKEFNLLIKNAGGVIANEYNFNYQEEVLNVSVIDVIQHLLGGAFMSGSGVMITTGLLSDSTADGQHYTALLINNDIEITSLDSSVARASTYYASSGIHNTGSFLVRNTSYIPPPSFISEPSTLVLFGLGLAGLGFSRRTIRQSLSTSVNRETVVMC